MLALDDKQKERKESEGREMEKSQNEKCYQFLGGCHCKNIRFRVSLDSEQSLCFFFFFFFLLLCYCCVRKDDDGGYHFSLFFFFLLSFS